MMIMTCVFIQLWISKANILTRIKSSGPEATPGLKARYVFITHKKIRLLLGDREQPRKATILFRFLFKIIKFKLKAS